MPQEENTLFYSNIQGFIFEKEEHHPLTNISCYYYQSTVKRTEVVFPVCGSKVYVCDNHVTTLKDMPFEAGIGCQILLRHSTVELSRKVQYISAVYKSTNCQKLKPPLNIRCSTAACMPLAASFRGCLYRFSLCCSR